MEKVIGIDLGTTNSCVATFENGRPVVIPNKGGYKTTPSIVAVAENGKRLVGHVAKRQAVTNAENTVFASKRLIGRSFDSPEVQHTIKTAAFAAVCGPNSDVRIRLHGKDHSISELTALILSEMRRVAEDYLGEPISGAVITVPAYFNDAQRQATKQAGEIAGLNILRIINEPTAAALAYGFDKKVDKKVAIFDFGGGTFDISILEIADGVFEVMATAGDTFLGGEDFDHRIINHLVEEFKQENDVDLSIERMAMQRLKDEAEKAKCELSFSTSRALNLPFIATRDKRPLHLRTTLTREKLEEMTGDLVAQCIDICRTALDDAGVSVEEIGEVILVGGQTRMPLIQREVEAFFGRPPCKNVHPDEVVAMGAAIQAHVLIDDSADMLLLDVTPMSMGIATAGGQFCVLIPRNTTIPTQHSHMFTTAHDNQPAVKIAVLQGESRRVSENQLLGEFLLSGIREMPKGLPEIEVTFAIDSNGIVNVSALDRDTGKRQSIKVTCTGGLAEEELQRVIEEQREYEIKERDEEAVTRECDRIESLTQEIKKLLPRAERLLGSAGVQAMDRKLSAAREAQASRDAARIRGAGQELERSLTTLRGLVTP